MNDRHTSFSWLRWSVNALIVLAIAYLLFWPSRRHETANASVVLQVDNHDTTFQVTGPYAHENLAVFLIHSDPATHDPIRYITLAEGLDAKNKWVEVSEKNNGGSVNELVIENKSDFHLFLQEGDSLKGGQQDRTIYASHIVPPRSGKLPVAAFCVEPNRWRAGATGTQFANPTNVALAPKEVRMAAKFQNNQGAVWNEVAQQRTAIAANFNVSLTAGNTSLNEVWENGKVQEQVRRLVDNLVYEMRPELERAGGARGLAIVINGQIEEANIYPNKALLEKQYIRLLQSYAVQALTKKNPAGTDAQVVKGRDVAQFIYMENTRQAAPAVSRQNLQSQPERTIVPGQNWGNNPWGNDALSNNPQVQVRANIVAYYPAQALAVNGSSRIQPANTQFYERRVNAQNQFAVQETTGKYACATRYEGKTVLLQCVSRRQAPQPGQVAVVLQNGWGQVGGINPLQNDQQLVSPRQQAGQSRAVNPQEQRQVQTLGRNVIVQQVQQEIPQQIPSNADSRAERLPAPRDEELLPAPREGEVLPAPREEKP